ncbi:NADH dehydrogenase [ubiquinone] 1 alpha subcomplex subunit 2 isoform X2 [Cricetulus griseus]|uniref:NADH dehydrogenase [ubiquinone] 1 alpha subcomplex subunit 2 n=1 Tax=Cricetulus griseus TaxID=10029 RepID=A0A9J7FCU8_CRIGR|nr:NADH dehydrogenase [ubiquinone] 1 alpha subcomplex subunit 2 isoform X2 [Cricetulus griseus]XP_027256615.1 NADH dehydrogenase [ubiquinone] 1 alpha subcomplex subunit 2 isoform X2 [Cricetulus griseus]
MAAAAARRVIGTKLALREIRIHLCQRSPGSQGVRDFIQQRYVDLKKAHPGLPILIRECSEVQPKLWARYDYSFKSPFLSFRSREECVSEQPKC